MKNNSSGEQEAPDTAPLLVPRVVIADQSAAVIERLAASIIDVAQVVGCATNARDAIACLRNGDPHLTVFDVAIADGILLLRHIKRHHAPVITVILTHSAEETTRRYCMGLGAEYFLDKLREFDKVREIVIAVASGWERGGPQPLPH